MPRIPLLLAILPTLASAVELPSILEKLEHVAIPDTAEYRVATTATIAGQPLTTTTKIVQAGLDRQWSETSTGGRTLRIVRNGTRQRILDVASGQSQTAPVPPNATTPLTEIRRLAQESWSAPSLLHGDVWRIRQLSGFDSTVAGRILEWSTSLEVPVAITQWNSKSDTLRTVIQWTLVEGHRVPSEIQVSSGAAAKSSTVALRFAEWRFPHAFPSGFFAIP